MKNIEKMLHYNYNTHLHVDKFDYKMLITTNKITKNPKNSEEKSFLSKNAFFTSNALISNTRLKLAKN